MHVNNIMFDAEGVACMFIISCEMQRGSMHVYNVMYDEWGLSACL